MRRLNRWYEGLSNWQFVAVTATTMLCILVAGTYVIALTTGKANISFDVVYDPVFTAALTTGLAWKRWK